MSKVILLDRDGVINKERGEYTFRIQDFEFVPGIIDLLKKLSKKGFSFSVVTNQGGVAKGLYTLSDVEQLHDYIEKQLNIQGIHIAAWWVSPHHQDFGNSLSRKPKSLLVERALHHLGVSSNSAILIGDSDRDIQAAEQVGVKTIKMESNVLPDNVYSQIMAHFS